MYLYLPYIYIYKIYISYICTYVYNVFITRTLDTILLFTLVWKLHKGRTLSLSWSVVSCAEAYIIEGSGAPCQTSPALKISNHRSQETQGSPTSKFSSVTQLCPTLCNPMDCSTPGLPVHHQVSELAQSLVHWVSDGIQPSHPLSSPSPPAFNLSQHQGLFQWVSSSHEVSKVSEFQRQDQSFQGLISLMMDWLDLLAVQGTLKSLLQHHRSKHPRPQMELQIAEPSIRPLLAAESSTPALAHRWVGKSTPHRR